MQQRVQAPERPTSGAVHARDRIERTDREGRRLARVDEVEHDGERQASDEQRRVSNARQSETADVSGMQGELYVNEGEVVVPTDPATKRIPRTIPATALMIVHIFALREESIAPGTSPAVSLLPTCDA